MSYGTKYRLTYTDYFNQSQELLIQKNDYSGAVTNIKLSGNPISITYDTPSDFQLDPINGSFMTMRLVAESDFQFKDLYFSNNREYQVIFNIDGSLHWKGFILPEQRQNPYQQAPYVNNVIATDQLGFLKTLPWDNTLTLATFMTVLNTTLGATDLGIDLWEAVNIYEDSNAQTIADSPLDQNYFDANVYKGKTYYDALKEVLQKFTSIIKQDRGKWFIYRPNKSVTAFQRRLWTWGGSLYTYDLTALYDPIVLTTSASVNKANLVRIANKGSEITQPAWKAYVINQSLAKKENNIRNGDFANWTNGKLDNWVRVGAIAEIRSGDKPKFFAKATHIVNRYVTQQFNTLSDRFKVTVSWNVFVQAGSSMDVYFELDLFGTGPLITNYDFGADAWVAYPPISLFKRTYTAGSEAVIQSDSIEIITTRSSQIFQSFLVVKMLAPVSATTTNYVVFESFGARIMKDVSVNETSEFIDEQTFDIDINSNNNFKPPDIELLCADAPVDVLADTQNIYLGALFTNAAKTIRSQNWKEDGGTLKPLIEIMQDVFSNQYRNSTRMLSVTIYSKLLFSSTIIQEINDDNVLYMMKRSTWDARLGKWMVEAYEIGQGIGAILRDEGVPLLDEGEVMHDD